MTSARMTNAPTLSANCSKASVTVVRDVGLFHSTTTGGDSPLDQRLRYTLAFTLATRLRHGSSPWLANFHRSREHHDLRWLAIHDIVTRTCSNERTRWRYWSVRFMGPSPKSSWVAGTS